MLSAARGAPAFQKQPWLVLAWQQPGACIGRNLSGDAVVVKMCGCFAEGKTPRVELRVKHFSSPEGLEAWSALGKACTGGSQTQGCGEQGDFMSQRTGILYHSTLGDGGRVVAGLLNGTWLWFFTAENPVLFSCCSGRFPSSPLPWAACSCSVPEASMCSKPRDSLFAESGRTGNTWWKRLAEGGWDIPVFLCTACKLPCMCWMLAWHGRRGGIILLRVQMYFSFFSSQ